MAFAQEIFLALTALILFFLSLAEPKSGTARKAALALSAIGIVVALLAFGQHAELFHGTYRVDAFSQSFKLLIAIGFFLAVAFGEGLRGVDPKFEVEFYLFFAISVLGLTFLVSSVELLTLYIALELSSYALYILVPLRRSEYNTQVEAGIKYVLFGAVASGVSLFGMSYVFGLAQTTQLDELMRVFPAIAQTPLGLMGLTMMLGAFLYKLALFPFHFWTPDVYQGAANETTGIIATLPKVGAVAVLIRLTGMGGDASTGFHAVLALFAILSMTYGNLVALVQEDLKRLLAFSSISHAGFMMVGILSGSVPGYAGAMYYVGGYLIMNLALFFVIYTLAPQGENITFDHLRGLYRRAPVLAFTLAVGAFGLAGIPPMAGFAGKFFVLSAAWQKGFHAPVIIAALNTAIGIFYYLRMVKAAFSPEEETEAALEEPIRLPLGGAVLGSAFVVAIVVIGAFPGWILQRFSDALHWVA